VHELYEHYYDHGRFLIPSATANSLTAVAALFEPFRQSSRILDIGFGAGGILSAAEQRGWKCFGVEVNPASLAYGKGRGWIVSANPQQDHRFPVHGFDVVTMFEVLEHLGSPDEVLHLAAQYLRPGGLLYLTTPNSRSLNRRLLHLDWSVFAPPEHLVLWTRRGIRLALSRTGFNCRMVRTEGLNPAEIVARGRRRSLDTKLVSRNDAGLRLNESMTRSPLRRCLKTLINRGLSLLGIGDTLKVIAIRKRSDVRHN
jgi:SAM-dependent methyltransferase